MWHVPGVAEYYVVEEEGAVEVADDD